MSKEIKGAIYSFRKHGQKPNGFVAETEDDQIEMQLEDIEVRAIKDLSVQSNINVKLDRRTARLLERRLNSCLNKHKNKTQQRRTNET